MERLENCLTKNGVTADNHWSVRFVSGLARTLAPRSNADMTDVIDEAHSGCANLQTAWQVATSVSVCRAVLDLSPL